MNRRRNRRGRRNRRRPPARLVTTVGKGIVLAVADIAGAVAKGLIAGTGAAVSWEFRRYWLRQDIRSGTSAGIRDARR